MSSAARDMRARGKDIDYSDFYTPEEPKKHKKYTAAADDFSDDDDASDDDAMLPLKRSKVPAAVAAKVKAKVKAKTHKGKVKDARADKPVAKAKKSSAAAVAAVARDGKKTKKRALTAASDDDDADSDDDAIDARVAKPKKTKRDGDRAKSDALAAKKMKAASKKLLAEAKDVAAASAKSSSSREAPAKALANGSASKPVKAPLASDASDDATSFRRKYEALRQLRVTESEQLLQEAKALALEEKQTYERIIGKLKHEVAALATQLHESERKHAKAIKTLAAEHQTEIDALERRSSDDSSSRKRIEELETQLRDARRLAKTGGKGTASRSGSKVADTSIQLAQATKLLEIYRLVTSTDIRLIETLGSDDDDAAYTDVTCATTDSDTGKQFHFDLGVPRDDDDEIEYLPSETPSRDFSVPSYLQDELSFKRPEMTKFMRTILDVVIRKKVPDARSGR